MKTFISQELYVSDVGKTVAFFVDKFGFEIEYDQEDFANLWCGATRLILNKLKLDAFNLPNPVLKEGALSHIGSGTELVLSVDDLDGTYSNLTDSIASELTEIQKQPWGLRDFRFILPDGHYVRVTEPDQRVQETW